MNTPRVSKTIKYFLLFTTLESIAVLISLIVTKSLGESTNLFGYSLPRFILILVFLFLSGGGSWLTLAAFKRASSERLQTLLSKHFTNPNVVLFVSDLFLFLFLFGLAGIGLFYYAPKALSFILTPLPNILERFFALFIFFEFVCGQSWWLVEIYAKANNLYEGKGVRQRLTKVWLQTMMITLALFGFSWGSYRLSADYVGYKDTPAYSFFPELAQAFLEGRLDLEAPRTTKDLTPYNGKYYVSFPPLGALLMLPQVARATKWGVNTVHFNAFFGAAGVALTFLALEALRRRSWTKLNTPGNLGLAVLFGFGTAQYYMASTGIVVHISQVLAATFTALALAILFSNRSSLLWPAYRTGLLAGAALAMAMLARPHVAFVWIALIAAGAQHLHENGLFSYKRYLTWVGFSALPLAISTLGLFWYNHARFGSPFDFGYTKMLVAPVFESAITQYGQFNVHYIWQNLLANWLNPPYWHTDCGLLVPDGIGMSIFITTPVLLIAYLGFQRQAWIRGMWVSVGIIVMVHLLYYNSGRLQFGYRFSLDFMVPMMAILAVAMKDKLPKLVPYLIIYSIGIGFIGVLWFAKQWCVTW